MLSWLLLLQQFVSHVETCGVVAQVFVESRKLRSLSSLEASAVVQVVWVERKDWLMVGVERRDWLMVGWNGEIDWWREELGCW